MKPVYRTKVYRHETATTGDGLAWWWHLYRDGSLVVVGRAHSEELATDCAAELTTMLHKGDL